MVQQYKVIMILILFFTREVSHNFIVLLYFVSDIDPDIVVEMGNSHLLDRMDRFLRRRLQNEYQFVRKTSFSIQFKFHNEIDVDLLLSPYWEKPEELHLYLLDLKQSDKMK